MSDLPIDQRLVWAISPDGQGDGVPVLIVGVPAGAWEYMKDGKTHHFDLTSIGMPIKMMFFGGSSHADVMKVLEQGMKASGSAYINALNRDFAIRPKPTN